MTMIECWNENSLTPVMVDKGIKLIRRRFREVWGIYRSDVTGETIYRRKNMILTDRTKIVGWLGIECDGQLTNACIEKGYQGVDQLICLIKAAYDEADLNYYYADVPVNRSASARAFLSAGMQLDPIPRLTTVIYPEREVILVRLSIDLKNKRGIVNKDFIETNLGKIKEFSHVVGSHHQIVKR